MITLIGLLTSLIFGGVMGHFTESATFGWLAFLFCAWQIQRGFDQYEADYRREEAKRRERQLQWEEDERRHQEILEATRQRASP